MKRRGGGGTYHRIISVYVPRTVKHQTVRTVSFRVGSRLRNMLESRALVLSLLGLTKYLLSKETKYILLSYYFFPVCFSLPQLCFTPERRVSDGSRPRESLPKATRCCRRNRSLSSRRRAFSARSSSTFFVFVRVGKSKTQGRGEGEGEFACILFCNILITRIIYEGMDGWVSGSEKSPWEPWRF